jgi:hypothetical protein
VGLCDYNPFGASLLLSYKYASSASAASAFEGSGLQTKKLRYIHTYLHTHMHVLSEVIDEWAEEESTYYELLLATKVY